MPILHRLGAPVLAGLLGAHASLAGATEPASGTLTPTSDPIVAQGGPYLVSNPSGAATGEPVCDGEGAVCDHFDLTLDLPASFRQANPNLAIRFQLDTESPSGADDLDLYVRDAATGARLGAGATASADEVAQIPLADLPDAIRVDIVPFAVAGATTTLTIGFVQGEGGAPADPCAIGEASTAAATMDAGVVRDLAALAPDALYGAFVQFQAGTHKQHDALLASLGLTRVADFRRHARSVFARGPASAFPRLLDSPLVARIEHNRPLRYFGDTGPWATGVRVAQEAVSGGPYLDREGRALTGRGITLGVIDGGLLGSHPDFAGRILHNFRLVDFVTGVAPSYVDVGEADSEAPGGGHGTHVTGTVAGSGVASDGGYPSDAAAPAIRGTYAGVAPEASIIHWGNGLGLLVLSAVNAYQHILDNADSFDPPLRAVNNSYGDIEPGTPYDPASTSSCLIKAIVQEKNIAMVFAAGNDGGDGSADRTSSFCKDPTPGVICVANYDDKGSGRRDGPLNTSSSRGRAGDPHTYPEIAAPGTLITSTCLQTGPTQAICVGGDDNAAETDWAPWYGTITGTSMASPHVTGALGLLLQARPELTPAELETLIRRTARKVGTGYEPDPEVSGATIHVGYGNGLLDIPAALEALGVPKAGNPSAGGETPVIDGDEDPLLPDAAADAVALTVTETVGAGGQPGFAWQLRVAAGDGFAASPALVYSLYYNVAGVPFVTAILADADGVSIPEAGPGNTAVASSAERDGDLVRFFVPHSAIGYPAVGSPVHNIRVLVGNDATVLDYAPSPAGAPAAVAAVQSMFGRPLTVLLDAGLPPPSDERSCLLPGLTQATSPPGQTGNGTPTGQDDLRQLWIAEPRETPGKLVFTIKVDNLAPQPIPGYRWYAYFKIDGEDNNYFVAMDTVQGTPRFIYGLRDSTESTIGTIPAVGGVGLFEELGTLDAASGFAADGTITLVLDKSVLGIQTGQALTGIAASIRQTTNPVNGAGLTVDSAAAVSGYRVVGNEVCATADGSSEGGGTPGGGAPATPDAGRFGGALGMPLLAMLLAAWSLRRRNAALARI
ncbi:S8 family serine peptidase [Sinimarinibacterium thermocellulolyticum]|uniref:S8 family serine peptidase n=1 Tax=Sinimarinibacterium thermocellulolyticum TaxID=3170016 RepID=A0ABV2AAW7_9GAMM